MDSGLWTASLRLLICMALVLAQSPLAYAARPVAARTARSAAPAPAVPAASISVTGLRIGLAPAADAASSAGPRPGRAVAAPAAVALPASSIRPAAARSAEPHAVSGRGARANVAAPPRGSRRLKAEAGGPGRRSNGSAAKGRSEAGSVIDALLRFAERPEGGQSAPVDSDVASVVNGMVRFDGGKLSVTSFFDPEPVDGRPPAEALTRRQRALAVMVGGSLRLSRTALFGKHNFDLEGKDNQARTRALSMLNYVETAAWLYDNAENLEISAETVSEINRRLTRNIIPVEAGGDKVAGDLNFFRDNSELVRFLKEEAPRIEDPRELAYQAALHVMRRDAMPDGNGRASRLMADLVLLKHGLAPAMHHSMLRYFEEGTGDSRKNIPEEVLRAYWRDVIDLGQQVMADPASIDDHLPLTTALDREFAYLMKIAPGLTLERDHTGGDAPKIRATLSRLGPGAEKPGFDASGIAGPTALGRSRIVESSVFLAPAGGAGSKESPAAPAPPGGRPAWALVTGAFDGIWEAHVAQVRHALNTPGIERVYVGLHTSDSRGCCRASYEERREMMLKALEGDPRVEVLPIAGDRAYDAIGYLKEKERAHGARLLRILERGTRQDPRELADGDIMVDAWERLEADPALGAAAPAAVAEHMKRRGLYAEVPDEAVAGLQRELYAESYRLFAERFLRLGYGEASAMAAAPDFGIGESQGAWMDKFLRAAADRHSFDDGRLMRVEFRLRAQFYGGSGSLDGWRLPYLQRLPDYALPKEFSVRTETIPLGEESGTSTLPESFVAFARSRPSPVFLHEGPLEEALAYHAREGYARAYLLHTRSGVRRRPWVLLAGPAGSHRMIRADLNGDIAAPHVLAEASLLAAGEGDGGKKATVIRHGTQPDPHAPRAIERLEKAPLDEPTNWRAVVAWMGFRSVFITAVWFAWVGLAVLAGGKEQLASYGMLVSLGALIPILGSLLTGQLTDRLSLRSAITIPMAALAAALLGLSYLSGFAPVGFAALLGIMALIGWVESSRYIVEGALVGRNAGKNKAAIVALTMLQAVFIEAFLGLILKAGGLVTSATLGSVFLGSGAAVAAGIVLLVWPWVSGRGQSPLRWRVPLGTRLGAFLKDWRGALGAIAGLPKRALLFFFHPGVFTGEYAKPAPAGADPEASKRRLLAAIFFVAFASALAYPMLKVYGNFFAETLVSGGEEAKGLFLGQMIGASWFGNLVGTAGTLNKDVPAWIKVMARALVAGMAALWVARDLVPGSALAAAAAVAVSMAMVELASRMPARFWMAGAVLGLSTILLPLVVAVHPTLLAITAAEAILISMFFNGYFAGPRIVGLNTYLHREMKPEHAGKVWSMNGTIWTLVVSASHGLAAALTVLFASDPVPLLAALGVMFLAAGWLFRRGLDWLPGYGRGERRR